MAGLERVEERGTLSARSMRDLVEQLNVVGMEPREGPSAAAVVAMVEQYLAMAEVVNACERARLMLCEGIGKGLERLEEEGGGGGSVKELGQMILRGSDSPEGRCQREVEYTELLGEGDFSPFVPRDNVTKYPFSVSRDVLEAAMAKAREDL